MKSSAERLLGGHAFGTLTDEERHELFAVALEDQELFDALVEHEPLREVLADRAVRNELLDVLDRPSLLERIRATLARPATWADLAAATAAVLMVVWTTHVLWPRTVQAPRMAAAQPAMLRALFDLPATRGVEADLRVEAERITFRVERDAQAIVAAQDRDGAVAQLFPEPGGSARVGAGVPLSIVGPRGAARIRLVVFPLDVDPLTLDTRTLTISRPLSVIEWRPGTAPGGKTA